MVVILVLSHRCQLSLHPAHEWPFTVQRRESCTEVQERDSKLTEERGTNTNGNLPNKACVIFISSSCFVDLLLLCFCGGFMVGLCYVMY